MLAYGSIIAEIFGSGVCTMRRVLIVMQQDDCLLYALRKTLERDYDVIAADAAEGGKFLKQQPDALILDLFLDETDGLTFLRQNRESLPAAVIVMSVYVNSDILDALAELGVSRVIRMPCTVSEVVKQLDKALRSPAPN